MLHTDTPHESPAANVHLGTAGWNVRQGYAHRFSSEGTHLARYASLFNAVEINSCFYRPHRFTTYERWAASGPEDFRFAVKLPKVITHDVEEMLVQHRIGRVTIEECTARGISAWCIFDNTALGAATSDALTVKSDLLDSRRVTR